jgi:GTPase SAR1 family protein
VGAIIVFDLTNRASYDNVKEWLAAVRERAEVTVQIALLGNKSDL